MPETTGYKTKPIEEYFPVEKVNEIAKKEGVGFLKLKFRPHLYTHLWWARRLGCVFRTIVLYTLAEKDMRLSGNSHPSIVEKWNGEPKKLWNYYTKEIDLSDKLILDCFMGGGTTISEARHFKAKVIGCDLNPVSWFMVKKQLEPVNPEKLESYIHELENSIKKEIQKYYKCKCPKCNSEANIIYTFWVKEVPCYNCHSKVPLLKTYRLESNFKEDKDVIVCPNCYEVHCIDDCSKEHKCPNCEYKFVPKKGNATRTKHTCLTCHLSDRTIDTVRKTGHIPDEKMMAIKLYCSECDSQYFKRVDEEDIKLYRKCEKEFEENKDSLVFPKQAIPDGYNTKQAKNYHYKYFYQMFYKRQLLCLSKLLNEILEIDDKKVKELLLLSFSKALDSNNMFCGYDSTEGNLQNMFARHDFAPKKSPVENNVWGEKHGARTFENNLNSLKEAMEFSFNPIERYVEEGKTEKVVLHNKIYGDLAENFDDLNEDSNSLLLCGDSSYLPIPDSSVDAVITDPPYGGNVMYSELADFFYVWLREALKDDYEYFNAKLTPKRAEIIQNPAQGKDEDDFSEGLTRVFSEVRKKLKDDGIMVFTFHHAETKTWNAVLKSLFNSGFYITAVYPVNSEVDQSLLIREKGNIEYDIIIVCRKREENLGEKSWERMRDGIYLKAREVIKDLESRGERITRGDMFVIAMGKCLEEYSKYYPNVVRNNEQVDVEKALGEIREIVDIQFMGGRFDELERKLDTPSASYLSFIAGRGDSVAYSTLNKELQQRAISIDNLIKWGLVKKEGSLIVKLNLQERAKEIEKKKDSEITAIDKAHYIQYLKEEDRLAGEIGKWADELAVDALEELSKIEKSKKLDELKEYVERRIDSPTLF